MKVLALLPVAAAGALLSSHANLDKMRQSLIQLANDRKSGKIDKITEETAGNIRLILTNLNDTLATALDADRVSAQNLLDAAFDDVQQCRTDRTTVFTTAIAHMEEYSGQQSDNFHACKDGNGALLQKRDGPDGTVTSANHDYGYNFTRDWTATPDHPHPGVTGGLDSTTHEAHARSDMKVKCDALDNLVKSFDHFTNSADHDHTGLKAQPNPLCLDTDSDDKFDIFRTDTHMVDTSYAYFKYMDEFEKAHAADYKEKRRQCHEARYRQTVRVAECHRLQHIFENAYCLWANTIDEKCHEYAGCYTGAYATFSTTNGTVNDMEETFKLQQHALEILLCYGDVILADQSDLSTCDGQQCTVCASVALDIVYTEPHAQIPCDEARGENRPCGEGWCNTNYNEYFGSEIPVDDCVVCSPPSI